MHWTIAAPFLAGENPGEWLEPFVPGDRHQFSIVPRPKPLANWHNQTSSVTPYQEWLTYWEHGKAAFDTTQGGVITVFPQLASVLGVCQQTSRRRVPVVAWLFNVGTCVAGARQWLAKASLGKVDCFVVHTRREIKMYSEWLGLPADRFEFVPYQAPAHPVVYAENTAQPFMAAIGSAHRDFPTLFEAVEALKIPTVLASGPRALKGLSLPANVQAPMGIGKAECLQLAQEARINVVPMITNDRITAAGQVTIVEAMHMGRALIATRCNGAEDYIINGETGLLVEPNSAKSLKDAIELLWNDADLRNRLGRAAQQYAHENFSDQAAGRSLGRILDRLADRHDTSKGHLAVPANSLIA
ncbi:MAG: glycosyltransferase [Leptolyngbyaceae cyanobacterium bins.349]|nr:glycosyltransferase [Leptolyngbyaceae cyanobacterium bins.349]